MGIEAIKQSKGVSRARAICDDCGRDETVACTYAKDHHNKTTSPNEAQARGKVIGMGWSYVKGNLRCPECEAKRKVVPMKSSPKPETPREPTKKQRLDIIGMLMEVYDLDAERYKGGDTDDAVADVLGVMPGWVAQIREAEFGPDGGNDNMEALSLAFEKSRAAFRDLLTELEQAEKTIKRIETDMKAEKHRLDSATASLGAIRKAVGPRNLKAAGVK